MQANKLIIPLLFLITGFFSAYIIFSPPANNSNPQPDRYTGQTDFITEQAARLSNKGRPPSAASIQNTERLDALEAEIEQLNEQLEQIVFVQEQNSKLQSSSAGTERPMIKTARPFPSALNQRLYNLDNLIRGGIDQAMAEDIVRRKNTIDLKKLQLQDLAQRENYLDTQRYYDELEALEQQQVDLRKELGDERYDQYLYNSKQNNRVRISSVMLGSTAEQAGIQAGDVVLSYDDKKLYTWQELKNATSEGELGEYVSISIIRQGQIFSYSVPRGPLGIQLGATRIQP